MNIGSSHPGSCLFQGTRLEVQGAPLASPMREDRHNKRFLALFVCWSAKRMETGGCMSPRVWPSAEERGGGGVKPNRLKSE